MQYKFTKQYSRDIETPLAEFKHLSDAEIFINAKISSDELKSIKLIYRLYDNGHLSREYNKDKIQGLIARAQYANGDVNLPLHFAFHYRVKLDFNKVDIAKFNNAEDARIFAITKIRRNPLSNSEHYHIFNDNTLIETIDHENTLLNESNETEGKKQNVTFRPTPFAKAPRPGPPKWLIDEDNNDDKEK